MAQVPVPGTVGPEADQVMLLPTFWQPSGILLMQPIAQEADRT